MKFISKVLIVVCVLNIVFSLRVVRQTNDQTKTDAKPAESDTKSADSDTKQVDSNSKSSDSDSKPVDTSNSSASDSSTSPSTNTGTNSGDSKKEDTSVKKDLGDGFIRPAMVAEGTLPLKDNYAAKRKGSKQ